MTFDYKTIEPGDNEVLVYGHGTYEESSVLAGSSRRVFVDRFESVDEASAAHPEAEILEWTSRIEGYNAGDTMAASPPEWFDPMNAGECWGEDDY